MGGRHARPRRPALIDVAALAVERPLARFPQSTPIRMVRTGQEPPVVLAEQTTARELYMLVQAGLMVRMGLFVDESSEPVRVWPVAPTYDDARRLAKWSGGWAEGVRPTRIGAMSGETIERHLALALRDRCRAIVVLIGWNKDGSPRWKWIPMDVAEPSSSTPPPP